MGQNPESCVGCSSAFPGSENDSRSMPHAQSRARGAGERFQRRDLCEVVSAGIGMRVRASGSARTETGVIGSPSSPSEAETADSSHAAPRPRREVRNGRPAGIPSAGIGRQFEHGRGLAELHGFALEHDADRHQRRIGHRQPLSQSIGRPVIENAGHHNFRPAREGGDEREPATVAFSACRKMARSSPPGFSVTSRAWAVRQSSSR